MSLIVCLLCSLLLPVFYADDTAKEEKIDLPCKQGWFLNDTLSYRQRCEKCPANTYWALKLETQKDPVKENVYIQKIVGAQCINCAPYLRSLPGSTNITACTCIEGIDCSGEAVGKSNLMIIIGVILTLVALGFLIGCLFFCRTHAGGIIGGGKHERLDTDEEMIGGKGSPDANLLDMDVHLEFTEEQIADNYNDITAKGDINDMDAVLKAAIISEKRRSRCYSINSMTDLSDAGRYRTRSECEKYGNNLPVPTAPGYPGVNGAAPGYLSPSQPPSRTNHTKL